MKKFIRIIGIIVILIVLTGGTFAIFRLGTTDDRQAQEEYTITYRMVITNKDYKEAIIYASLFKKDGSYPKRYNSKDGAVISDLERIVFDYEDKDYIFKGWYLNPELTRTFDGTIDPGTAEDITLYAKVEHCAWTGFY